MSIGIGLRIKTKREEIGMTQLELSQRMGYKSKAAVCKVENGDDNLTTTRVKAFANALGCTPSYLMGWDEEIDSLWEEIMTMPDEDRKKLIQRLIQYELDYKEITNANC